MSVVTSTPPRSPENGNYSKGITEISLDSYGMSELSMRESQEEGTLLKSSTRSEDGVSIAPIKEIPERATFSTMSTTSETISENIEEISESQQRSRQTSLQNRLEEQERSGRPGAISMNMIQTAPVSPTPHSRSRREDSPVPAPKPMMPSAPRTSRPRSSYRNALASPGSSFSSSASRSMQSANLGGSLGPSVPRPYNTSARRSTTPGGYAKSLRMNGTGPVGYSPREIDDKTRAVLNDINDFNSNESEVEHLAVEIFSPGTGISDDEVRKIMRVRVSSKTMDLEQQVAAGNKVIKRLKDVLTALTKGKNEFLVRAIDAEKNARNGWAQALETAQLLDEDRGFFKQKVKQLEVDNTIWKDNAKDTMRELSLSEDKMQNLKNEIEDLKDKLQDAESNGTKALIALEVEKARNEEAEKQSKELRDSQFMSSANVQAAKAEAVRQAEVELNAKVEQERASLKAEINEQHSKIKELESQIILAEAQFARAVADADAANARASTKDADMTELMKSISEIQQSGNHREEEANKLRREAENKVSELERSIAEIKGNMNVTTHEKATLESSLTVARGEKDRAIEDLKEAQGKLDDLKTGLNSHMAQLNLEKELRMRSETKEREERNERIALSAQMVAMTKEHAQMETQLGEASAVLEAKWRKQLEAEEEKHKNLKAEILIYNERIAGLEGEIDALKDSLQREKSDAMAESASEISKLNGEINIMKERLRMEERKFMESDKASEAKVLALENQLRDGQMERRKMHNLIQELRGNVRVFARIRPFLPGDGCSDDALPCIVPKSETSLNIESNDGSSLNFSFDRVFSPSTGQDVVFTDVSEFVQSALDGYNVCLFSYGQTGSGKTHTMQGTGFGQMRGIIPRSIEQVGNYKTQLENDGWRYEMQVSFLEIYNETIRDLLREDNSEPVKHKITVQPDGKRAVSDLTMVALNPKDSDAVEAVMRQAAKHRSVASTQMNDVSSRSHSVFTLHLTAIHPEANTKLRGVLNLVDLAGSERLDRSGATGARAKEAMAINKSLSSLTDVFVAIGKKRDHIPFRNSTLTWLLQPSLSGDGKTLMMVNLSPTEASHQESVCSLRFAAHVNKCELGKAKRSVEEATDDDERSMSSRFSSRSGETMSSRKQKSIVSKANSGPTSTKPRNSIPGTRKVKGTTVPRSVVPRAR